MTPAHARLLLEALEAHTSSTGGDAAAVARALARLPASRPGEIRRAREDLEACAAVLRGGTLTSYGRSLAFQVGAAVHAGRALPFHDINRR